jgi:hypothetical protein
MATYFDYLVEDVLNLILIKLDQTDLCAIDKVVNTINYNKLFKLNFSHLYKDFIYIFKNDIIFKEKDNWKIAYSIFLSHPNEIEDIIYYDDILYNDMPMLEYPNKNNCPQLILKLQFYKIDNTLYDLLIINKNLNDIQIFGKCEYTVKICDEVYVFKYFDWCELFNLYIYSHLFTLDYIMDFAIFENYIEIFNYLLKNTKTVSRTDGDFLINLDRFYDINKVCTYNFIKYFIIKYPDIIRIWDYYIPYIFYKKGDIEIFKFIIDEYDIYVKNGDTIYDDYYTELLELIKELDTNTDIYYLKEIIKNEYGTQTIYTRLDDDEVCGTSDYLDDIIVKGRIIMLSYLKTKM